MLAKEKSGFIVQQRYVLTAMIFFALVTSIAVRSCLSLTITQMVIKPNPVNETLHMDSSVCAIPVTSVETSSMPEDIITFEPVVKFEWSQLTQGAILSSFYIGYIITHIPGAMLAHKFGAKYVLAFGILLSAIMSIMTPFAVHNGGAEALIAVRFFMGVFQGPLFPSIAALLAAWVPAKERCRLCSVAFAGMTLGTISASYVSGQILHHTNSNWELVFYFFGAMAIMWFTFFVILCYSTPAAHPFISQKEKDYLMKHMGQLERSMTQGGTPWRIILTSTPVWALILAALAHDWCYAVITVDLPKYMNDVLHVSIKDNGIYNSVPWMVRMMISFTSSFVSDYIIKKGYIGVTNARKLAVFLASIFPALFMIAATYAGCHHLLVFVYFIISIGAQGFITCGTMINPMDLSPNYAGAISSLTNLAGSTTGIAAPYVVGLMTPNSLLTEWRLVFLITAGIQIMQTVIFTIMGTGKVQSWNFREKDAITIQSKNQMARNSIYSIYTIRYDRERC